MRYGRKIPKTTELLQQSSRIDARDVGSRVTTYKRHIGGEAAKTRRGEAIGTSVRPILLTLYR